VEEMESMGTVLPLDNYRFGERSEEYKKFHQMLITGYLKALVSPQVANQDLLSITAQSRKGMIA
jgi:hypothetical protein